MYIVSLVPMAFPRSSQVLLGWSQFRLRERLGGVQREDPREGRRGCARTHQLEEVAAVPEDGLLDRALDDPADQAVGALGLAIHPIPPVPGRCRATFPLLGRARPMPRGHPKQINEFSGQGAYAVMTVPTT
jgi:hypothetical protein